MHEPRSAAVRQPVRLPSDPARDENPIAEPLANKIGNQRQAAIVQLSIADSPTPKREEDPSLK